MTREHGRRSRRRHRRDRDRVAPGRGRRRLSTSCWSRPTRPTPQAATGKGTGGIRQLFTRPENILLSQYTLDVVEDWETWAGAGDEPPGDLGWRANGYLFIAGPDDVDQLRRNFETQQAHGVDAEWLEPAELGARHPELRVDDLAGAVLSPRDGWLNPAVFFAGVQARARAAGVRVIHDRVTELVLDQGRVTGVRLQAGGPLAAEAVLVCAGTWTPELVAPLGMTLPIEPMRRHEHYVTASATADDLPFVKDVAGSRSTPTPAASRSGSSTSTIRVARTSASTPPTSPGSSSRPPPTGSAACPASSSSGSGPASTTRTGSTATPSSATGPATTTTSTSPPASPGTASCTRSASAEA